MDIDSDGKLRWMHRKIENKTFPKLSFEASERTQFLCMFNYFRKFCSYIISQKKHTHRGREERQRGRQRALYTYQACMHRSIENVNICAYLFGILNCNSHHHNVLFSVQWRWSCFLLLLLSNSSKSIFCYFHCELFAVDGVGKGAATLCIHECERALHIIQSLWCNIRIYNSV